MKKTFFSSAPIREEQKVITETDPATGIVTCEGWYKDGEKFEPSAEVRAAWLQKAASGLRRQPLQNQSWHRADFKK